MAFFSFKEGDRLLPSLTSLEEAFDQELRADKNMNAPAPARILKVIHNEWSTTTFIKFLMEKIGGTLRSKPPVAKLVLYRTKHDSVEKGKKLNKVA